MDSNYVYSNFIIFSGETFLCKICVMDTQIYKLTILPCDCIIRTQSSKSVKTHLRSNYCRIVALPGRLKDQPWCFTNKLGAWNYCDILPCEGLILTKTKFSSKMKVHIVTYTVDCYS